MNIREFEIPGVKLIVPKRFSDARGYFSETWNEQLFRKEIANVTFVQDNQSFSTKKGGGCISKNRLLPRVNWYG